MKIQIKNYTFVASTGTVIFKDYTSIDLRSILLITNVTSNIIIYNFAGLNLGGQVTGNTLTLDYDTSSMSSSDDLQIFYEDDSVEVVSSSDIDRIIKAIDTKDKDICIDMILDTQVEVAAPGIQKVGISDSFGNPLTETNGSLNTNITNTVKIVENTVDFKNLSANKAGGYILPITDVTGYKSAMLTLNGTWAGTVAFQGSNDLATWLPLPANVLNVTTQGLVITTTVAGTYEIPLKTKYLRIICTAYTSGNIQGSVTMDTIGSITNNPTIGSVIAIADGQAAKETLPNAIDNAGAVGPLGAGGAQTKGDSGGNSVFSTITCDGGGGGGDLNVLSGNNGGSGGAPGASNGTIGNATGNGTGNNSGTSVNAANAAGGGGGSGSVGGANAAGQGGAGGSGTSNSISGSAVVYSAGGGGGADAGTGGAGGSSGAGGAGANGGAGTGGTATTYGSGGGGGSTTATGGNGKQGVVILSWVTADFGTCSVTGTGNAITTNGADSIATFIVSGTITFVAPSVNNFKNNFLLMGVN